MNTDLFYVRIRVNLCLSVVYIRNSYVALLGRF